jgi:tetratricopeptide (TPR) repeat protein
MQRHDFASGLASFRSVIQGYPSERELVERAHLFVRVCERETAKRPPTPQTPTESVYAATVALNAGDPATALSHLNQALQLAPESDHAHYVMSLALIEVGDKSRAYEHLTRAISLNPEIRSTAIQEPDLAVFHDLDILRDHHESSSVAPRRRLKPRR